VYICRRMNQTALLPTAYLPPVNYFSKFFLYDSVTIEKAEFFVKQTYRNRCSIYGANGKLDLIIPLHHEKEKTLVINKHISYNDPWHKLHWKSLQSAYRNSPWFEFFETDFERFYNDKFEFLFDFNTQLIELIFKLLKQKIDLHFSTTYEKSVPGVDDLRNLIQPKTDLSLDKNFIPVEYYQVFGNKFGFIPGLSIVDLLFNEGLKSIEILKASAVKINA
jgi:hypothetical protein